MYCSQPPRQTRCTTPSGLASITTHFLGPHPLIQHYVTRLNVESTLQGHLGMGRQGILNHAKAICVLIHNILTSPGPLYRLSNWIDPIEAEALGLTEEQKAAINDDRIARALDALASERARGIWFRLALRAIKHWELAVQRVHFDTTTITFFGEYESSVGEPRIMRGYNKDHRPDLKQLVFGLNITNDGAVPLLHKVWSGNRTDDNLHKSNFDRLRQLLGRTDFIYVADSKLATTTNMGYVAKYNGKFVTVLPRSRKEDKEFRHRLRQEPMRWKARLKVPNKGRDEGPPDIFSTPVGGEMRTQEGYRLTWYRSSQKARQDGEDRKRALQKAEMDLDGLARSLEQSRHWGTPRAKLTKQIRGILSRHGCESFLKTCLKRTTIHIPRRLRRGRPAASDSVRLEVRYGWSLGFERDEEALKAEARTDGVFPLVSHNLEKHSRKSILDIYKYQPYLEKRFSQIKSDLSIAPVFIKTPKRAAALLDVYFIAIAVGSLLERDLRMAMRKIGVRELPLFPEGRTTETPTAPRILEAFAPVAWQEFRRGDELICFPLRLNSLQKKLLGLLDIATSIYR